MKYAQEKARTFTALSIGMIVGVVINLLAIYGLVRLIVGS